MLLQTLLDWLIAASHSTSQLMIVLLVQTSLLILLGLAATRIFQSKGPALQSYLLRMTVVTVLLCPLVSLTMSEAGVQGKMLNLNAGVALSAEEVETISFGEPTLPPAGHRDVKNRSEVQSSPTSRPTTPELADGSPSPVAVPSYATSLGFAVLAPVCFLGSGLLLIRLMAAHMWMRRVCRTARPADRMAENLCRGTAARIGVTPPPLRLTSHVHSPCLVGFWRPVILLPAIGELTTSEVLLHELAHLARRDCLFHLLARLAAVLFWFQPLAWLLSRRIEQVADDVCDDYVLEYGCDRDTYASALLDVAERFQPNRSSSTASVGVASLKSSLGRRVVRILDTSRAISIRTSLRSLRLIVVLGGCTTGAVALIGSEGWAAQEGTSVVAAESDEDSPTGSRGGTVGSVEQASAEDMLITLDLLNRLGAKYEIVTRNEVLSLHLTLDEVNFREVDWSRVERLPRVELIEMGGDSLTDKDLVHLTNFPDLEYLELGGAVRLPDAGLKQLGKLNLRGLGLRNMEQVTDTQLRHLATLMDLQTLILDGTGVRGAGLEHLQQLTDLRRLSIYSSPLSDSEIESLGKLVQLEEISFYSNTHLDGSFLRHLKPLGKLENVGLGGGSITDEGLEAGSPLPQVRTLSLYGTRVTDAGVKHLKGWKQLEVLSLNVHQLTATAAVYLNDLPSIRELSLSTSRGEPHTQVTDSTLRNLRLAPRLESLRIHGGPAFITAAGVSELGKLPNLKQVTFDGDSLHGADARASIGQLKQAHPNLTVLVDGETWPVAGRDQ